MIFRRHKRPTTPRRLPPPPPPPPPRVRSQTSRLALLKEYDFLRSIPEAERSEGQELRRRRLAELLWPAPEPNPMNGIRRIPGGHGYPVPDRTP